MLEKLPKKQLEIMKILWNKNEAMIASEIEKCNSSFTTNSVHSCLKELLKKDCIKVSEIVYSGTVLTRSYLPTFSRDQYLIETCDDIIGSASSHFSLCASLIKVETNVEELRELEKLIEKRKEEIEVGK